MAGLAKRRPRVSLSDDGTTVVLMLKPGADMTRVGNILSGVNGTVVKSTTIQATGQRMLKVRVPAGTSANAQQNIKGDG